MFGLLYSWRLKRRQRSLALAWCGDRMLANWLLKESRSGFTGLSSVEFYRHMANLWLQHVDHAGTQPSDGQDDLLFDPDSPHDPVSCRVRRLISQMPMSQRMTLSLIDVARLNYRETATVMNVGLFDVQYHVVTARSQLLKEIHSDSEQRSRRGTAETAESC